MSLVGSASSAVLGFLIVFLAARLLGDHGAGVLLQVIALFTILTVIAKLGMDSAALWLLPRLIASEPTRVRGQVNYILTCSATVGLLAGGALLVLIRTWSGGLPEASLGTAGLIIAVCLPFGTAVLVAMAITRATGAVGSFVALGNVGLPLLRLGAVAGAAWWGLSAMSVSAAWALAVVPILGALLLVTYRRVRKLESTRHASASRWPTRPERRKVLGYALPRTISAGLEQALVWLDVLIVGTLLGAASAGVYGSASRFIAVGLIIDTAVRIIVAPRFSVLLHQGDLEGVTDLYRTATQWLVLFASPGLILLAVFAPVFLGWLGPDFASGAGTLTILALGSLVTFLAGNIHTLLLMSGHTGWAALNKAVALSVSVGGCLLLVPRLGITGAALAWVIAMVTDALLATLQVLKLVGVPPQFAPATSALIIGAGSMAVPALAFRTALGAGIWSLVSAAFLGLLLLGSMVYWRRDALGLNGILHGASATAPG